MRQGVVWVACDGAGDGSSSSMGHVVGVRTYWCVATSHALNTCEVVVDGVDGHLACVKYLWWTAWMDGVDRVPQLSLNWRRKHI